MEPAQPQATKIMRAPKITLSFGTVYIVTILLPPEGLWNLCSRQRKS